MHWTFIPKVQCKSSMHWTFGQQFNAKVQCIELLGKSSTQKFNALNFWAKVQRKSSMHWTLYAKSSMQKFNALNFFTKSSMQKFNALNFRAEVLHWSLGSKVHCIGVFLRWNPRSKYVFCLKCWVRVNFCEVSLVKSWSLEGVRWTSHQVVSTEKTTYCAKWSADVQVKNGNPSQENFLGTLSKGQTVHFSNWNYRTNWESFDIHVV